MSYSSSNLAEAVLRQMGVVDAQETPDTLDTAFVQDAYSKKLEELNGPGLELVYWTAEQIPPQVFLVLRDLMILEVQGAFGQPVDAASKIQQEEVLLYKLRRHTAEPHDDMATTVLSF